MSEVVTPSISINASLWLATLDAGDLAWIAGAACQRIAALTGITEADLFADWAKRAAADPDCNVVRPA